MREAWLGCREVVAAGQPRPRTQPNTLHSQGLDREDSAQQVTLTFAVEVLAVVAGAQVYVLQAVGRVRFCGSSRKPRRRPHWAVTGAQVETPVPQAQLAFAPSSLTKPGASSSRSGLAVWS